MYNNYNAKSDENLQKSSTDVKNQEQTMSLDANNDFTKKQNSDNPFNNVEKRKGNFFVDNAKYLISIGVVIVVVVALIIWANAQ